MHTAITMPLKKTTKAQPDSLNQGRAIILPERPHWALDLDEWVGQTNVIVSD